MPDFVAQGLLVLFAEGAPEELHDFSVLHRPDDGFEDVQVGDVVCIGEARLKVTAVGGVVNANLRALGHAAFKANGKSVPDLPGDLCVEAEPIPLPAVGEEIRIELGDKGGAGG